MVRCQSPLFTFQPAQPDTQTENWTVWAMYSDGDAPPATGKPEACILHIQTEEANLLHAAEQGSRTS